MLPMPAMCQKPWTWLSDLRKKRKRAEIGGENDRRNRETVIIFYLYSMFFMVQNRGIYKLSNI